MLSQIKLDFPDEYLIQVKGTMGSVKQENVVTSLMFITNKQSYGPYGSESGRTFQSSSSGSVVGFYGRSSLNSLDQIGCIKEVPSPFLSKNLHNSTRDRYHGICTIYHDGNALVIPQGPWGGWGGQEFYDGRGDIVDLIINYTDDLITSIQVGYEQGGISFQGGLHGGKGATEVQVRRKLKTLKN